MSARRRLKRFVMKRRELTEFVSFMPQDFSVVARR
jgi:hypothetical protein